MDRRRFAPSAEALEGKALLSLFGVKTTNTSQQISVQDLPETFRQKELRIEHLPFYLEQTQPGRFLPSATITKLQSDLGDIAAELHAPTTQVVDAFNHGLQHALPYLTLSTTNAHLLNASFGSVLDRAGATPQETANLRQDMNQLALVDSKSIEPSLLARNDYSLVLQTALSIGRPIQTPRAPELAANDGIKAKNGESGYTHDHLPTFVGSYEAGATRIGFMRMQIVDASGTVFGVGVVDSAGHYSVKLTTPLPDGNYAFHARAIDEVGHQSDLSPGSFKLKVITKAPRPAAQLLATGTPGGPLGLK